MAHDLPIYSEEFNDLLCWLHPDQEIAIARYFTIRRGLVKLFEIRGCVDAEELADETIDRVVRKANSLAENYHGEPAAYFFGVAKNVFRESARKPRSEELPEHFASALEDTDAGEQHDCLDRCLDELSADDRRLIIGYYSFEKGNKAGARLSMAESMGMTVNHLRIRAFRIRDRLHKCIENCLAGDV
jgi:RNA polymerase sigma factor (sigma-70 family)